MSTVSTAFVESYRAMVTMLAQQTSSRLRKYVKFENTTGKKHFFDQIGTIEVNEVVSRFGDSPSNEIPHYRRACNVADFNAGTFMDGFDATKLIADPKDGYVRAMHAAFGRKIDKILIAAATADALTGAAGTTTTSLPSGQKVDVTLGHATGITNAGLTVEKLKNARSIFAKNEVIDEENNTEEDAPILVCSQQQIEDLLGDSRVTNSDYAAVKALVDGKISYFMGFRFLRTELLTLSSTTDIRTCFAFVKSGLGLCINEDVKTKISERADKNYNWYAYMEMSMGATRLEEEKVVEIPCDQSPS